jgi:hypothetical protein
MSKHILSKKEEETSKEEKIYASIRNFKILQNSTKEYNEYADYKKFLLEIKF